MTTNKILITPRSLSRDGHPALEKLTAAGYEVVTCTPGVMPDEDELKTLVADCVGWLAGVETISDSVLAEAKELKVISRNGTGANNVDMASAERRGIAVKRAAGANARGVAELAVSLMFSLVRSVPFSDSHLKSCGWERRKGIELAGRTLGLVGCGAIGQLVATMATGIGMKVIATDPYPREDFQPHPDFRYGSFDEVIEHSDVISLHCPPPEDGQPLIDHACIARMKRGVYLINTARGDLLDDAAVIAALVRGAISGAAIDAFRCEPPGDDPLVRHDRVIATPHIGAFTNESVSRAVELAVDNILAEL